MEKEQPHELLLTEYGRDAALLKQLFGEDVVLVIPKTPAYVRNRLVREGIPFIVPGAQMFLLMLLIDLRERYLKRSLESRTVVAVSQLVVVYQILRDPVAEIPLGQLVEKLAYSPQAMSHAEEESSDREPMRSSPRRENGLSRLHIAREGIVGTGRAIMSSPVRRTQWVPRGKIARARGGRRYDCVEPGCLCLLRILSRHMPCATEQS